MIICKSKLHKVAMCDCKEQEEAPYWSLCFMNLTKWLALVARTKPDIIIHEAGSMYLSRELPLLPAEANDITARCISATDPCTSNTTSQYELPQDAALDSGKPKA
jgi:hypothetical protein